MKSSFHLLSASVAVLALSALGLSACSPSTPASTASASSETATVTTDDTTADTTEAVTDSEASSAATVVVTQAETYDPVVIKQMGQKPGYWEVKHTDPKTKKSYVTHVCVDTALGAKMTNQGPVSAPSDRRDYKDDASFKGECPSGVRGGDVQKSDGKKVNAYGDRKPQANDHDQAPGNGQDNKPGNNDSRPNENTPGNNAGPNAQKDQSGAKTPQGSNNPHATPAEQHGNDKPKSDRAGDQSTSSALHPGENH
ncbi:MAG: hypothetical protein QM647_09880 [Asticcacaulis sp.]|uniref:hypothetical protein n=1 Tax=Asticcacaulis sp. TaxID=1872648 RepID=UPI0039E3A41F